jgi:5-methylthioadenosine/S-adenosylhomocysteine deaminase
VARHGLTPVALLDELGALTERTVAVHAIHLSETEKEMLARAGARVVHNPTTNQYLGDGICDVVGLRSLGVPIALGTDADIRPSLIDEMRSAALLAKLRGLDGAAMTAQHALAMGTREGARALALDAGDLLEGGPADYLVLDASEIDPWSPECNALIYRGQDAWVQATFVNGRRVYTGEASPLARRARREAALIAERLCVGSGSV